MNSNFSSIAIIGAGNMGGALARGLAQGTLIKPSCITVSNPSQAKLDALKAEYPSINITTSNVQAVTAPSDSIAGHPLIVLAVKPWIVAGVIEEIKPHLQPGQAIASMVGGMSIDELAEMVDDNRPIFCLIPNTAIAVRESMTFFCSKNATKEQDAHLLAILKETGDAMQVRPDQLAGGTSLASCGIAFAMRYLRAATEGGVQLGFYAHDAQRIVMQTMKGMVALLEKNGTHPEAEIDRVTTPGGITIKGLNAMEKAGFTNAVIDGLLAAVKKN